MTTEAYPALTEAQQIFKDLVWTPALKAGETWLETNVGVLALPVIKDVDEKVLQIVADWAFAQICLWVDITAIKLVNSAHQSAYDEASLELAIIAQEKGIGSLEYQKARVAAQSALARFTQLAGS